MAAVAYAFALHRDIRDSEKANTEALAEIHCSGATCDTSDFTTDWYTESPDYVIDTETNYFLSTPESSGEEPTQ
jgi:hypothetical protein